MATQEDVLKELPLTEATFYVLLSLASGQKHGYAIMKEVEDLSDARVTLSTGTLYGALGRLLDQGWIERMDEEDAEEGGRQRKAYVLSNLGRRILMAETSRLDGVLKTARLVLQGGGA